MDLHSGQSQTTIANNGSIVRKQMEFKNQESIVRSYAKNLCGRGGLPISLIETAWFRAFMKDVEPRFSPVSRVSVKRKLDELYSKGRGDLIESITSLPLKPSVTVDFWSGRDGQSFMGCTVHFIQDGSLKNAMLFFREVPPPHTAENIRLKFEDELDQCQIQCFQVVTDTAVNMKRAFRVVYDDAESDANMESSDEESEFDSENESGHASDDLGGVNYWSSAVSLSQFEGWIGCAAHQLQLVVHDGYKEL